MRFFVSALVGTLLLSSIAFATDAHSLPSRKPDVVLPLLKLYSVKDGPARIKQILGKEDVDIGSGIYDCVYRLNDGTGIRVRFSNAQVYSIFHDGPGFGKIEVIYALNDTWKH